MKIIAKVPKKTLPYERGMRLMACEVTENFEYIQATDFFKTKEEAKRYTDEHPEYKWDNTRR